jgi:hypothetical protein
MCARKTGLPTQTLTLQALVDFTLSLFSECAPSFPPAVASAVSHAVECFLQQQMSYKDLTQTVVSLTGIIRPLEHLRVILETSPVPLPDPQSGDLADARRPSRTWSRYEDQRLLAGIYKNGIDNWTAISKFVGNGRTRSQCSQRWYRGLNPKIRKDHWSPEEEQRLLALVAEHGEKSWTTIALHLGNRSDVQCRYRYHLLVKGRSPEDGGDAAMLPPLPPCGSAAFFRPAFPGLPPTPIRVPLLQDKNDECSVQFHSIPALQLAPPSFGILQAPAFFAPAPAQQGEGLDHGDQPFRLTHRISAPTFDGRLYSVC